MTPVRTGTASSTDRRNWWLKHRWLLLRRASQLGILGLFLLGPLAGIWIIKGNLNSSITLDVLPLSDPFVLLQSWLAGRHLGSQALLGAIIVAAFYFLVGGRAYCAWVCPVNIITDFAHWLRQRLGLRGKTKIKRHSRYWLLGVSLLVSAMGGYVAWELINPVSVLHRGLLFGMGAGWLIMLAVFLLDLAISQRGWCGHLCPVGAFYSLLGTHSPIRVRAERRDACDQCMDCFDVCPEPQVIRPALFGLKDGIGPVINEPNCTNCGRCIDICSKEVFTFGTRFGSSKAKMNISGPDQAGIRQTHNFNSEKLEQEEART